MKLVLNELKMYALDFLVSSTMLLRIAQDNLNIFLMGCNNTWKH